MSNYSNIIDLSYSKDDIRDAKDWSEDTGIYIILPCHDVGDLDEEWSKWNSMSDSQKAESDRKSKEIFDVDNYDHYIGLKNKMFGNTYNPSYEEDIYAVSNVSEESIEFLEPNQADSKRILEIKSSIKNELKKSNPDKICLAALFLTLHNLTNPELNLSEQYELNNTYPFFTPEEMIKLGVYHNISESNNFYKVKAENILFTDHFTTQRWFNEEYFVLNKGITTDKTNEYTKLWIEKLNELYSDFDKIKQSGNDYTIRRRKQTILELGWNPEVPFSIENRIKVNNKHKKIIKEYYDSFNFIDLSTIKLPETIDIEESKKQELFPVFIILSFNYTKFGTAITKVTNSIYSHVAMSLDTALNRLYTFNAHNGNGFVIEGIKDYMKTNIAAKIRVYCVFVNKSDIAKIKITLDRFLNEIKETSYGFSNLIDILLNKSIELKDKMVCSQFVDITHKSASLTRPKDFEDVDNKNVYKIYEGSAKEYDENKVKNILDKVSRNAKAIKEGAISDNEFNIKPLLETKEFPVEFDKDGNLLIKKIKSNSKIDFESEYAKSHKLLLSYEKADNIEGMKYELSALWFMNNVIEDQIYNNKRCTEEDIKKYTKARAKILNDFKKYLDFVQSKDKQFNFTKYYNDSPFSDASVKITNSTLKYSGKILVDLVKSFI